VVEDRIYENKLRLLPGLVLVAAGKGQRFGGDVPKQFRLVEGTPIYLKALLKFVSFTDQIVIVVPRDWEGQISDQVMECPALARANVSIQVVPGGKTRQESVLRGLKCLRDKCTHVLIHDAARPFVCSSLITRVISAMLEYGAAIPMEPVTDTVKRVEDNMVVRTLDRSSLRSAQTPQGSELRQLLKASERAAEDGFIGTDESSLLEREGLPVRAVEGDKQNIKITWKEDLDWRNDNEA